MILLLSIPIIEDWSIPIIEDWSIPIIEEWNMWYVVKIV